MSRRCDCTNSKGAFVWLVWGDGKPTKSCTCTIRKYRAIYGAELTAKVLTTEPKLETTAP